MPSRFFANGISRRQCAGYLLLGNRSYGSLNLFPICLVIVAGAVSLPLALAQTTSTGDNATLPVGVPFTDFYYPTYDKATQLLDNTFSAKKAVGITPHRARAYDVKIDLYEMVKGTNTVTTVITSPDADVILGDKILRTQNTVRVEKKEMVATAQKANFDVGAKQYALRGNVVILLKDFDVGKAATGSTNNVPIPVPNGPTPVPKLDANDPYSQLPPPVIHDPGN